MESSSKFSTNHSYADTSIRCCIESLRNEKLFVDNEKENIQSLFTSVTNISKDLVISGWLLGKQWSIFEALVEDKQCVQFDQYFQNFNDLEKVAFIDGTKVFRHHEIKIGKFLHYLYKNPDLAALLIHSYYLQTSHCLCENITSVVLKELYGSCVFEEEEKLSLKMIKYLIMLQTENVENISTRLIHLEDDCLMQTIQTFVNSFQDCQAFITALLKEPILVVILDDESNYASNHTQLVSAVNHFILSINQQISSFPQSFSCVIEYLHQSLVSINDDKNDTRKIEIFIVSLIMDMFICSPLSSPLQHENHFISPSVAMNLKLIAKILKALVLQGLDCNMESDDTNAKVDLDDDVSIPLDSFDQNSLSCIIDMVRACGKGEESFEDENVDKWFCKTSIIISPESLVQLFEAVYGIVNSNFSTPSDQLIHISSSIHNDLTFKLKKAVQHNNLPSIDIIRSSCSNYIHKKQVKDFKSYKFFHNSTLENAHNNSSNDKMGFTQSLDIPQNTKVNTLFTLSPSSSSSFKAYPGPKTKSYIRSMKKHQEKLSLTNSTPISGKSMKVNEEEEEEENGLNSMDDDKKRCACLNEKKEVILISLGISHDCPGMKPEHKVLKENKKSLKISNETLAFNDIDNNTTHNFNTNHCQQPISNNNNLNINNFDENKSFNNCNYNELSSSHNSSVMEKVEKKTRFSLSNLPTGSNESEEAMSSHSTEEEEEEEEGEDQHRDFHENNSNISDAAYSGNLSGRNTPSIVSGRDTPVSLTSNVDHTTSDTHHHEHAENPSLAKKRGCVEVVVANKDVVVMEAKSTKKKHVKRDDVTEKFGKFEIKHDLESVEAKSTVSETWSTDVLASDSETPETNALERLQEVSASQTLEQAINQPTNQSFNNFYFNQPNILINPLLSQPISQRNFSGELLETASDAWSTDVMMGEKQEDRLLEVDQEDSFSGGDRQPHATATDSFDVFLRAPLLPASVPSTVVTTGVNNNSSARSSDNINSNFNNATNDNEPNENNSQDNQKGMFDLSPSLFQALTLNTAPPPIPPRVSRLNTVNKQPALVPLNNDIPISNNLDFLIEPFDIKNSSLNKTRAKDNSVKNDSLSSSLDNLDEAYANKEGGDDDDINNTSMLSSEKEEKKKKGKIFSNFREKFKKGTSITIKAKQSGLLVDLNQNVGGTDLQKPNHHSSQASVLSSNRSSFSSLTSIPQSNPIQSSFLNDDSIDAILNKYKNNLNLHTTIKPSASDNNENKLSICDKKCAKQSKESFKNKIAQNNPSNPCTDKKYNADDDKDRFEEALLKLRVVFSKSYNKSFSKAIINSVDANNNSANFNNKHLTNSECNNPPGSLYVARKSKNLKKQANITASPQDHDSLMLMLQEMAQCCDDETSKVQIFSTIDCLKSLPHKKILKLAERLKRDYEERQAYIIYLVRTKKELLSTISTMQTRKSIVAQKRQLVVERMVGWVVEEFMKKQHASVEQFVGQFNKIIPFDEKCDFLVGFLNTLHAFLTEEFEWKQHKEEAHTWLQRAIFSRVYSQAFFFDKEVDLANDSLFLRHLKLLSDVVTADHKDISIPMIFRSELPWSLAQKHLRMIDAYKTPEDKVNCVLKCCNTIDTLLSLSLATHGCPYKATGADELAPVLLYVIIKSSMPHLLSNIRYIESYCFNESDKGLKGVFKDGKKIYCWTHFVALVSLIKNMN